MDTENIKNLYLVKLHYLYFSEKIETTTVSFNWFKSCISGIQGAGCEISVEDPLVFELENHELVKLI